MFTLKEILSRIDTEAKCGATENVLLGWLEMLYDIKTDLPDEIDDIKKTLQSTIKALDSCKNHIEFKGKADKIVKQYKLKDYYKNRNK